MTAPRRILVVKLSDIGDVLTATPSLHVLRATFPQARIDMLVPPRSAAVLRGLSSLDEVIVFDKFEYDAVRDALAPGTLRAAFGLFHSLRARRYDMLVLPHHLSTRWGALKWAALALAVGAPVRAGLDNGRGWFLTHRVRDEGFGAQHEVEYCLAVVEAIGARTAKPGAGDRSLKMEVGIAPSDRDFAVQQMQFFAPDLQRPIVALHPGSGGHSLARRWPLERGASLGSALCERHRARLVVVGTASDGGDELAARLPSALNLTGRTTLSQLAAVLQQCSLFVGADSGVMHIAAAAGASIVALFGTTNARAWGPWCPDGHCAVVQSEMPGCPCAYVGFKIRSDECEARECMKGITVEQVLAAIDRVLQVS